MLQYVFENDNAELIYYFIENKIIAKNNFDKYFLDSALKAKATQCVAVLLDWKNKNSDSEKDVFSELEL